jgi:septal ring factor EnvC (AmiA/AmiB activator)
MSKKTLLLLFLLCLVSLYSRSQTRDELKEKRKEKQDEIAFTKKLLNKTSKKQRQTVEYLQVLNKQIENRSSLIETIQKQVSTLDSTIQTNESVIQSLEADLASLKEEYADMVQFAYKTRNQYQKLSFIFSAEDFNTAYKRLRFLSYYSDFRKEQLNLIKETRQSLRKRVQNLESRKAEKRELLSEKKAEKQELEDDLVSKRELVDKLKSKKAELKQDLRKKRQRAEELANAIQQSIRREREKSASEANSKAYANTPKAELESERFKKNKANLPWPVEQGFISSKFGKHEHPTLDGVQVQNNGIHITTADKAEAKAVFNGEVRRIVEQRGSGFGIVIRHGEYYTVYSNLGETSVKPGEAVEANQVIGTVRTNSQTGNAELHFQVWKSFEKLNPEKWLASK